MIVRERLLGEMSTLAAETKWEDALGEILAEMFEVRPSNPYLFLQKKASLRQKMDNSKTSHYLIELTLYITHIDPLLASEEAIKDKIISLCVEKFQHTKIKSSFSLIQKQKSCSWSTSHCCRLILRDVKFL